MKRIMVGGSGGTPSLNFTKSLRKAGEKFYIIGMTSNKYDLIKSDADEKYLVPLAKDPAYRKVLLQIIHETRPDFLHVQNDTEVKVISDIRDEIPVRTFLPSRETVDICIDKYKSFRRWMQRGIKVPQTMSINSIADLKAAFKKLGPKIWLRAREGAFGYGAVPTHDFEFAKIWIDYYKGWGNFTAAECLEPESITWMSLWKNGELIVAQGRKRLYWEFSNRNVSGVTGITGTGVTISDHQLDQLALAAIDAMDDHPHGIFSVDMTYDKKGIPNPTEINIGRFFTTHQFFTDAGLNMPYIYIKAAFDEPLPHILRKLNPLKDGLAWVRGMDTEPVLTTIAEINNYEQKLQDRLKKS